MVNGLKVGRDMSIQRREIAHSAAHVQQARARARAHVLPRKWYLLNEITSDIVFQETTPLIAFHYLLIIPVRALGPNSAPKCAYLSMLYISYPLLLSSSSYRFSCFSIVLWAAQLRHAHARARFYSGIKRRTFPFNERFAILISRINLPTCRATHPFRGHPLRIHALVYCPAYIYVAYTYIYAHIRIIF